MALRFYISTVYSDNIDVKKYLIKIYSDDDFLPVYEYNRNSISYSGVYLPSYTTIFTEANDMVTSPDFSCGLRNDYDSILNLTISSNRLINYSSVSPKNGDILGLYLNSSSVVSSILNTQIHYFEYGYVTEEYKTQTLSLNLVNGELLTSVVDSSFTVGYVTCVTLVIRYAITSLPPPVDTRIETTCCVLACCEPDKYILI